jgi:hypothetical protein
LDHRLFAQAKAFFEDSYHDLYLLATNRLEKALEKLYSDYQSMSLQRLSATFRRGDLLEFLNTHV